MEVIKLWSDGGCRNNQCNDNIGAYAYLLEYWVDGELKHKKEFSEGEKNTTNNIQELKGCIFGLKAIKNKNIRVEVYLDSKYVLQGCQSWISNWKKNGWKTSNKKEVKNKSLWIELDKLLNEFDKIEYYWVKGHDESKGNNRVDFLLNKTMDNL